MWNDAVVTNAGKELLAQWLGGGELVIDSAATGQGTVAASLLMGQTELVSKKQNMSIVKAENIGGGRRLQLQLTSEGVTIAYTINQIGIWAKLGDGDAKMIAIFQDNTGISVPTFEQMPDYVFTFYATIQMSNSGELVVNVDKSAIVTRADFEEHTNNNENPHEVTQKQLFDDLTETTALAATDFIPIEVVADGTAKKISKENLHKALGLNTTSITGATVTLGASQTYSGSVKNTSRQLRRCRRENSDGRYRLYRFGKHRNERRELHPCYHGSRCVCGLYRQIVDDREGGGIRERELVGSQRYRSRWKDDDGNRQSFG